MFQDPAYDGSQGVSDNLTTLRQFVGGLAYALGDQSYAGTDGVAYNPSGQFQTVGPNSIAVEGKPFTVTRTGGVQLSSGMTMLLLGALAVLLLKRG
ncbi:MAG TPA: hypothetical protein VF442_10555 [Sphingobium sp.]